MRLDWELLTLILITFAAIEGEQVPNTQIPICEREPVHLGRVDEPPGVQRHRRAV